MTLEQWLKHLEQQSPSTKITMGLERVKAVAEHLDILSFDAKVITVGGTNGKGSVVAALEQLLVAHHKKVASYTSPHLVTFNERIKLDGRSVDDARIVEAFEAIAELSQHHQSLSYFEWITLSALWFFKQQTLDYIILEVGLGGRLDAVNVVDPDIAIITSIDFDHMDILGDSLSDIADEKAGIFRSNQTVFCAENRYDHLFAKQIAKLDLNFQQLAEHYHYQKTEQGWLYRDQKACFEINSTPQLHLNNMATALACFNYLEIPSTSTKITQALTNISLMGRCQYISSNPAILIDVAHNAQSIRQLCHHLQKLSKPCLMVFSMLAGKDILTTLQALRPYVAKWFIAPVDSPRALSSQALSNALNESKIEQYKMFNRIEHAYRQALSELLASQTLVVCGSFITVGEVLENCLTLGRVYISSPNA